MNDHGWSKVTDVVSDGNQWINFTIAALSVWYDVCQIIHRLKLSIVPRGTESIVVHESPEFA
jgi:hypothetical protein